MKAVLERLEMENLVSHTRAEEGAASGHFASHKSNPCYVSDSVSSGQKSHLD